MAKRPTSPQVTTLERIRTGLPANAVPAELHGVRPLQVLSFESVVDGDVVRCHRTIATDNPMVGRTELFRVARDGFATQF